MPRKHRLAKPRVAVPLSPAIAFLLMTGAWAPCRIHGWVEAAVGDADPEAAWAAHRDHLIAEARRHGFEPFQETGAAATGPAFERWEREFFRQHRY